MDRISHLLTIINGYKWHFKQYSSDQEYAAAEEYARKNMIGLWGSPNPVAPWEWRKN